MVEFGQMPVSRSSRVWVVLQVTVREADSASDLKSAEEDELDGAQTKAVYELTGLVAHIMGDAEEHERPRKKRDRGEAEISEGHIVAHIKVGHSRSHATPHAVVMYIIHFRRISQIHMYVMYSNLSLQQGKAYLYSCLDVEIQ